MSSILLPISPAGSTTVASGLWLASGIQPNISGQAVSISGNVVIISGVQTVSVISGAISIASGAVSIASGSITINSGITWMESSTQSGHNMVLEVGKGVIFPITSGNGLGSAASGGMTLASCGPLVSATIRSQSGNGPMVIGGAVGTSGTAALLSGTNNYAGIELFAGESLTLKVTNTNLISVFNQTAGTSGQKVTLVSLLQT